MHVIKVSRLCSESWLHCDNISKTFFYRNGTARPQFDLYNSLPKMTYDQIFSGIPEIDA